MSASALIRSLRPDLLLDRDYEVWASELVAERVSGLPAEDYVTHDNSTILRVESGITLPTSADLVAHESSAAYATWLSEHGGDPVATSKRKAEETLDNDGRMERIVVAVVQGILDTMRTQVPTTPDPTPTQIINALRNRLRNRQ